MSSIKRRYSGSLNNDATEASEVAPRFRAVNRVKLTTMAGIEQNLGWNNNAVLTGLSFKRKNDGWLATIKADFPEGSKVAFLQVQRLYKLFEVLEEYANKDHLTWQKDKWPIHWRSPGSSSKIYRPRRGGG